MQHRRLFTLVAVLVVAAAGAVPAFAQGGEKLAGIERALEVAAEAVEWARTAPAGVSDGVVPQTSRPAENPLGDEPQQGGSGEAKREKPDGAEGSSGEGSAGNGNAGKGNGGKGSAGKGSAGKGSAGNGNAGKGNGGKGSAGNGNSAKGNSSTGTTGNGERDSDQPGNDKSQQVTGRDRAAAAIAAAVERGSSKGAADKDTHAAEVLAGVRRGEAPPVLEGEAGYGAHMSAMIRAYNDLRDPDEPGPSRD